jgi:type IV secretory pathway VirB4 component
MTALCGIVRGDEWIAQALAPMTSRGIYPFFDGVLDDDVFDVDYLTFEIGGLLKHPLALNPLCSYMSFIGDSKASPTRPLLELYDEAHAVMMAPFDKRIGERVRTARRDNITVGFASQNMRDFSQSSIADTLLDNCPNRFILPDPELTSNAAVPILRGFGLSDGHIRRTASARPNRQYAYQRKGGEFVIIDLELMEVGLALCTTTNSQWVTIANETLETFGRQHFLYGFLLRAARVWPGLQDALAHLPEPPLSMLAQAGADAPLLLAAE